MWTPDASRGSLGTDGIYLLHKGLLALLWDAGLVLLTKYLPTTFTDHYTCADSCPLVLPPFYCFRD